MKSVNITNFRKNIYEIVEEILKYNEPVNISTKNGNVIIISEDDYNALLETLYIETVPGLKEKILDGAKEPLEDSLDENEVDL